MMICCCCCCWRPAEGKKEAVDSEHGTQQLVWHLNVSSTASAAAAAAEEELAPAKKQQQQKQQRWELQQQQIQCPLVVAGAGAAVCKLVILHAQTSMR
jgi:hypothetical protein